ncbi:MAG: ABC transporter permease [Malacoplasma sp.]|nr:ABC transporter permease [Malacoplasma sp.]
MKNLFKNVLRSLKQNKLAIIGLTFLTFLSCTVFTGVNSTVSAVNSEYGRISRNGNLHQFTVSELYETSTPDYEGNVETYEDNGQTKYTGLYDNVHLVKSNDEAILPYFEFVSASAPGAGTAKVKFKSFLTLSIGRLSDTSPIKSFYIKCKNNEEEFEKYKDILEPEFEIELSTTNSKLKTLFETFIAYINTTTGAQKSYGKDSENITDLTKDEINTIINPIVEQPDYTTKLTQLVSEATTKINEVVSTESTPIQQFINTELVDQVKYRKFESLNIDNSSDNIYYKTVKSNPTDNIDRMVLIDSYTKDDGTQWNNFKLNDCTFNILGPNDTLGSILSSVATFGPDGPTPNDADTNFDVVKKFIQKAFLLNECDYGGEEASCPIWKAIQPVVKDKTMPQTDEEIAAFWKNDDWGEWDDFDGWSGEANIYHFWETEYKSRITETVYVKDYRVTIQWQNSLGALYAASIQNWTSSFAVVNPEYMEASNHHTMTADMYENVDSYKEYVKKNPGIVEQKQKFIGWLNSLSYPDIMEWLNSVESNKNYADRIITPGGGTPYIIIGTGITPDFIYPIVSIERSTPNPSSECIYFCNDAGYSRIMDGFRSNTTENYLVGTFSYGVNKQRVLNQINEEAAKVMIYPRGIKAAYMLDDINNVLNASAFRVVYIPNFINNVTIISNILIGFVVILSIIICAIVIHRYIMNSQTIIGILSANGVSKNKIALSLMPFALIPSVLGGFIGVLLGTLLQIPVLQLFKNYWMLPTATLGFPFGWLFLLIIVTFIIFFVVAALTAFYLLRKKSVDLMKPNSQENPNFIARAAKATMSKFGIIAKYRISVAFNSLWKLIVLTLMTTLSMSTLVFATSINGKFEAAVSSTTKTRNYDYAVKLQTPTMAGGQYITTNYYTNDDDNVGLTGISGYNHGGNDERDYTYLQSLYFGEPKQDFSYTGTVVDLPGITYDEDVMPEITFKTKAGDTTTPLNWAISRQYYYPTMFSDWTFRYAFDPTSTRTLQEHLDAFNEIFSINSTHESEDVRLSNLFFPWMDDKNGQEYDIFYLKDRQMTKDTLDYVVGSAGVASSNPWIVASSMMPDNNKKLAEQNSALFIDKLARCLIEPKTVDEKEFNTKVFSDDFIKNNTTVSQVQNFFTKNEETGLYVVDPEGGAVPTGVLAAVCLSQPYIRLLTLAYNYFNLADLNYCITYKTVPMLETDETFTYVNANNNIDNSEVVLMGIKATPGYETRYVNLKDANGYDLLTKLHYTYPDYKSNRPYPIVVNEFVATKYNLSIGSTIGFNVTNRVDRIDHQVKVDNDIEDKEYEDACKVNFNVVGIFSAYQGQEYFIDQDLANHILGLKSHLFDSNRLKQKAEQPNEYYGYTNDTIGSIATGSLSPANEKSCETLINLKNYSNKKKDYNLTGYGFNGVFTSTENNTLKNPILSKGINLYAPSGIWCGADRLDSKAMLTMLQAGANLKIACTLLYNNNPEIPFAKEILDAYDKWQGETTASARKTSYKAFTDLAVKMQDELVRYFGTTSYQLLLSGAIDKLSTSMVYGTLSSTMTNITNAVIGFVAVMVVIIVCLMTNMVINDSRKLAALLKTLGYSDRENIITYLSIYIPVILFGLGLSALLTWGLLSLYNTIILNSLQLWINASANFVHWAIGVSGVVAIFALSGAIGGIQLKKTKVTDEIKN